MIKPKFSESINFNLTTMLAIVISAATFIVIFSFWLYQNNDNRKYDIARPGEPLDNQALDVDDATGNDTTSLVDGQTYKKKLEFLQKESEALQHLGNFDQSTLSDQSLQLTPADDPAL